MAWISFGWQILRLLLGWGQVREQSEVQDLKKANRELKAKIAGTETERIFEDAEEKINAEWREAKTAKQKLRAIGNTYRHKRDIRKLSKNINSSKGSA